MMLIVHLIIFEYIDDLRLPLLTYDNLMLQISVKTEFLR